MNGHLLKTWYPVLLHSSQLVFSECLISLSTLPFTSPWSDSQGVGCCCGISPPLTDYFNRHFPPHLLSAGYRSKSSNNNNLQASNPHVENGKFLRGFGLRNKLFCIFVLFIHLVSAWKGLKCGDLCRSSYARLTDSTQGLDLSSLLLYLTFSAPLSNVETLTIFSMLK